MRESLNRAVAWPRPGYPILPALYRKSWLNEPLPQATLARAGLPIHTTIGALDESIWKRAENPDVLRVLANHVATLVKSRLYFRGEPDLADQPILGGTWHPDIDPRKLPYAERTLNVLRLADRMDDTSWLCSVTASELLSLPNAGWRTLLDFATVTEAHEAIIPSQESELAAVQEEFAKLRSDYPVASISTKDPRLRDLSFRGSSITEALAIEIDTGRYELFPLDAGKALARVASVRSTLRKLETEKLDEALLHLVQLIVPAQHSKAISRRLGWDGKGGCTLQEAAEISGVSRERIRQIEKNFKAALNTVSYVPALDRAIEILDRAAETFEPDAAYLLQHQGITSSRFLPKGVAAAAEIIGRSHRFELGPDRVSVQLPGDTKAKLLKSVVRSLSNINYVASLLEVQARVALVEGEEPPLETVRAFLERNPQVAWLDGDRSWFWVRQAEGRNRLVAQIRKILAAAGSVQLETLRDGVLRNHRTSNTSLPRLVFEGLCRAAGFHVTGGVVSASEQIDTSKVLGGIETAIVDVLRNHGNVMNVSDLRDECLTRGVNRHSFWVYLTYSPLLERVGPSVYVLRGAAVDPAEVAHLLSREKGTSREPALQDHGWTKDGAIWLGYRAKRNIIDSGVVSVPADVRRMIGERKLELFTIEGTPVGTLVIGSTGNAWGLTPFIGRRGINENDTLLITIDTDLEVAMVQAGSKDSFATHQDGNGWGPRHFLEVATRPLDEEVLGEAAQ